MIRTAPFHKEPTFGHNFKTSSLSHNHLIKAYLCFSNALFWCQCHIISDIHQFSLLTTHSVTIHYSLFSVSLHQRNYAPGWVPMQTITEPSSLQSNTLHNCFINRVTEKKRVTESGTQSRGQQPECGIDETNISSCYCDHRQSHSCAS